MTASITTFKARDNSSVRTQSAAHTVESDHLANLPATSAAIKALQISLMPSTAFALAKEVAELTQRIQELESQAPDATAAADAAKHPRRRISA